MVLQSWYQFGLVKESKFTYTYNMGLPKLLTEQQKKFAELLVYNEGRKTPTECAIEAGYAEVQHMLGLLSSAIQTSFPSLSSTSVSSGLKYRKNMKLLLKNTSQNSVVYAKKLYQRELLAQLQMQKLREEKQQDSILNKR